MIRVYTASKLSTAAMWRELGAKTPHVFFHARWLKHIEIGTEDSPKNAKTFWLEDVEDVKNADVVLVYAPPGEHLRGALVEAGVAIAFNIPVVVVGDHDDYGTWRYHPGVQHALDLDRAMKYLKCLDEDNWRHSR